jgi:Enoyl-(Acyl carrier protein) reductase
LTVASLLNSRAAASRWWCPRHQFQDLQLALAEWLGAGCPHPAHQPVAGGPAGRPASLSRRRELADDGIRTVALAPGLTDTPGMRDIVDDAYIERVAANYPGGRLGQPEDIVGLAVFLCSEAASHLSGTVLTVRLPVTR